MDDDRGAAVAAIVERAGGVHPARRSSGSRSGRRAESSTMMPATGVAMPLGPQKHASSAGSVRHGHTSSRGARKARRYECVVVHWFSRVCKCAWCVSSRSIRSDHVRRLSSIHESGASSAAGWSRHGRVCRCCPRLIKPDRSSTPDVLRHGLHAHGVPLRQLLDRRLAGAQPGHDVAPGAVTERGEQDSGICFIKRRLEHASLRYAGSAGGGSECRRHSSGVASPRG